MMAPARENNTEVAVRSLSQEGHNSLLFVKKFECTTYCIPVSGILHETSAGFTYQALEVLAILAAQATVCLPYPIPARCVPISSSKEDHGVVGFNYDAESVSRPQPNAHCSNNEGWRERSPRNVSTRKVRLTQMSWRHDRDVQ